MKNRFTKMFAVFTALLMFCCILPAGIFAEGEDIPIDAEHFPDENFRNFVLNGYYDWYNEEQVLFDTDGSGALSPEEIAAVTNIDVSYKDIADLTGIGYFTALTELNCSYNQLTQLDVSKNTALTELLCSSNRLTQLDVSKNTALTKLSCDYNQLTSLDVSKNTALTELYCGSNQLTQLDVSKNTALTKLSCDYNQLTQLDVSKNTALTELSCYKNQLTSLDLSKNTALAELDCGYNQLTTLDVSKNTALTELSCSSNQLTELDVSKNTELNYFGCNDNQLTELDVSKNTKLYRFNCENNQLTALDISVNTALYWLWCDNNQLTQLDVSNNVALEELYCYSNQLAQLDVSANTALYWFNCENNQLTALDVSGATALEYLYCSSNQLTSLDVSKNTTLRNFSCNNNQLTSLDLSNNTVLEDLDCSSNQLTSLDLSANTNLNYFNCAGNSYRVSSNPFDLTELPGSFDVSKTSNWNGGMVDGDNLTFTADFAIYTYDCGNNHSAKFVLISPNAADIPIDEGHFPDPDFRNYVSENWDSDGNSALSPAEIAAVIYIDVSYMNIADLTGIEHFIALEELNCFYNQLTELDVSKNTALNSLSCWNNQLTELDVSKNTALTKLYCQSNQLTELDVSNNTALTKLDCGYNQLTELDVSKNTALTELDCYFNQLASLDVSRNTELDYLSCSYNKLTSLDVSANIALMRLECGWNQLTQLDVSENTALTELDCSNNQLTELDVSNNTALTELDCGYNQLTSLDVSENTALTELDCGYNQLTTLDVSKNNALTELSCSSNQLTSLDVSENNALTDLLCYYNKLTSLDVSKNNALEDLDCSTNQLTSLDVSKNTNLTTFYCYGNQYTVSSNPLDLTTLPGNFDISKASNWQGGSVSGSILTFTAEQATYTYDCGNDKTADFTLLAPEGFEPPTEEPPTAEPPTEELPTAEPPTEEPPTEEPPTEEPPTEEPPTEEPPTEEPPTEEPPTEEPPTEEPPTEEPPTEEPPTEEPPTEEPPAGVIGYYFETDPVLDGWTWEDRDGDGYNWEWKNGNPYWSYPEGEGCMASFSYDNDTYSPLTPDNWLISPEVPGGGSVSFMIVGQDPNYAAEVVGVYASTDGGESWSEELGYFTATGSVQTFIVSLADFADMNIKLAFRHYDSYDQFSVSLDAVKVFKKGELPGWIVTFIDDFTGSVIGNDLVETDTVLDPDDFPAPPEHYGYHFTGWDYDGSTICEDTEITAQYEINTYYVHFIDNLTGEELCDVQKVRHGYGVSFIPEPPEHEGYRFAQWYNAYDGNDPRWNSIRGDYDGQSIYIYAMYHVEITFCDWNGVPFAVRLVDWNYYSTYIYPPAAPEHNGYTFTGWSPEFYNRHYYHNGPKTYIAQYSGFDHPADPDIIFKTNTVYTKPDTDVTIDFSVEALRPYECHAFTGFLYYEPSELTLIDNELIKGEVWQQIEALGGMVAVDTSVPGKIGLTVIMPNAGFDMSGTIFSMNFHVENYHDWQGYKSPLFIEIAKCVNYPEGGEETPIVYDIENGSVNIYDMTFGDVNWDGKTDTTDVILIMRYVLGVQNLTGKYLAAADFNHDGVVDATDALLLMRYIMN